MRVEERGFVVTGAGSGLGAAITKRLVERDVLVLLVERHFEAARAMSNSLGMNAKAFRADVTTAQVVTAALDEFRICFGDLHGLVNCAGVAPAEKSLGKSGPHQLESFARTELARQAMPHPKAGSRQLHIPSRVSWLAEPSGLYRLRQGSRRPPC